MALTKDIGDIAIQIDSVYKTFKLPHERHSGIKQMFINSFRGKSGFERQQVLKDISFTIKKGEFFGIVGRNGSGKSTLLKLLAGIYVPDSGSVHINGSLTPFIELGVGFNPELTGRENVFLNGALLGFNHKEMEHMYSDIVAFAELEDFMDQKLKNYSSGMQVRLAFSIAIRAKTDILLIDEVLAVGDTAFQKKCFEHFVNLKKRGATVILVTHDMSAVERFCDRAMVIDGGVTHGVVEPAEAATMYNQLNASREAAVADEDGVSPHRWGTGKVTIKSVSVVSSKPVKQGNTLTLAIETTSETDVPIVVGLAFVDQFGTNIAGPNSSGHSFKSNTKLLYEIDTLPLAGGEYDVTVAVFDQDIIEEFDHNERALKLHVSAPAAVYGKVNLFGTWSHK